MNIDRRGLMLPVLAIGLLGAAPAFAGADEDTVAKNLEAFRVLLEIALNFFERSGQTSFFVEGGNDN